MKKKGFITVLGCQKCGKCDTVCGVGALVRIEGIPHIDHKKCNLCLRCMVICQNNALRLLE